MPVRIVGQRKDIIVYLKRGELVQNRVKTVVVRGIGVVKRDLDFFMILFRYFADCLAAGVHELGDIRNLCLASHAVVGFVADLYHTDIDAVIQKLRHAVFCKII